MVTTNAMQIARAYARHKSDEKALLAAGISAQRIYMQGRGSETFGNWKMRSGELLGVIGGFLPFGTGRKEMVAKVAKVHSWGAVIVDVQTGLRSDRNGAEMLDAGLSKHHGERAIGSPERAADMQRASVEARTKGRMPRKPAQEVWNNVALTNDEAIELMTGWSIGTAYRAFGPRGIIAGRKPRERRRGSLKKQKANGAGVIYFVRANGRGPVKIGYATDVKARVRGLQTSHHTPLVLMSFINGTHADEGALHKRFAKFRMKGEWFRVKGELKKYLEGLPRVK